MTNTTKDAFRIVEKELTKFGSYENVRSMLSKYMVGQYDQQVVEKLLVILIAEFRHRIEKLSTSLPDDETEASAIIEKRAASKRGSSKTKSPGLDIEVVDDFDIMNADEEL